MTRGPAPAAGHAPPWLAPALVFGAALLVYALTAPAGLTWAHHSADGGDLVTAALVRGVPHPTGYPTWTLLAALFSHLPLGTAAWRATLLSMLSGAAAAALVAAAVPWLAPRPDAAISTARDPSHRRSSLAVLFLSVTPALVAGLALAFAPLLWGQATVAEVYALHACLAAAALWALVRWQAGGRDRWAAAAGLFLGLGLGNHLTTAWLLPAAAIVFWAGPPAGRAVGRARSFAALGAGLAAGLAVYLYLPLAAAGDPPVNWAGRGSVGELWWLVSGQLYRGYAFAVPWVDVPGRLAGWSAELWRNFLPWGMAAALLGLAVLWEQRRALAAALSTSLLLGLAWAVGYNTSDSHLPLTSAWVIVALAGGVGVAAALQWLDAWKPRAALAAAALSLVLVVTPLPVRWPAQNLRHDRAAEQFYRDMLGRVEPDALVATAGDRATFALWYGRYGLGLRPDVALASRDLWPLPGYRGVVASQHPELAGAALSDDWRDLLAAAAQQRPVYLAQAGLNGAAMAPPAIAGFRAELAQTGDGWALWRLSPFP